MTQQDTNFFNIDNLEQGISRELADGVTARIFPGEQAMVSVVRVAPNARTSSHSHAQEQWGLLLSEARCEYKAARKSPSVREISGSPRAMSSIALSQARKELLLSTSSHRHGRNTRAKNMAKTDPEHDRWGCDLRTA